MCGIAGLVHKHSTFDNIERYLIQMTSLLTHRGPDAEGHMVFNSRRKSAGIVGPGLPAAGGGDIGFGHRRLSIIDLSKSADQPMTNFKHNLWIIFNGEIFNYIEIRWVLEKAGYIFRNNSDTEVILNAYDHWGPDCLHQFNGMWAFVIYDLKENILFGARDRFGIKPFYYHDTEKVFSFASEIKSIISLPWVDRNPELSVIKDYLYHSRVNTSKYTFFKDIYELYAGHYFVIDLNNSWKLNIRKWWNLAEHLETVPTGESEICYRFAELMRSAIQLRLRSDVPIGTCLSGGLDSSAIACLAEPYISEGNQKTFSIVQPGYELDESRYIDIVLDGINAKSWKKEIRGSDLLADMDRVITSHDEPFTSTSMYAQWKVFQLAREKGVTVTLDGQGADELLAGYTYFKPVYWAELLSGMKLKSYFNEVVRNAGSIKESLLNSLKSFGGFASHRQMIRAAGYLDPQYKIDWINGEFFKEESRAIDGVEKTFKSRLQQRLYEVFAYNGLPALIRYADRNSMAHGLESRMPFLDYRLVRYLFSLSSNWKIRNGYSKYVLRVSLQNKIPNQIINRRDKIGFATAKATWFRYEMRDFILNIISSKKLKDRGIVNILILRHLFRRHLNNEIDFSKPIWRVCNLELWFRKYID